MFPLRHVAALCCGLLFACSGDAGSGPDASVPADAGDSFPPARTDIASAVGSPDTLDIATWNLKNFPRFSTTAESAADLIASLALDIVVVQEIQNVDAFAELVARLPGYEGLLSAHQYGDGTFQKLGVIYRSAVATVDQPALMFQNNGYEFPRPPYKVRVQVVGQPLDFDLIGVHLKAGLSSEEQDRRQQSLALLEGSVRASVDGSGDDDVLIIGDFNDTITLGADVFGAWLTETDRYRFETQALADDDEFSFIPAKSLIDHIVSTSALQDDLAGSDVVIPPLLQEFDGYTTSVSDHLPVVLRMPLPQ